ncbi:MAG: hypothetical protein VX288_01365 [Planctomycetota bacterium]|nr:hypothetical protein [Planctomycetota bacterium]
MMFKGPGLSLLLAALLLASGCNVLVQPDRSYLNNQGVIAYTARAAGYAVDQERYTLQRVELEWDTATFYYAGVGDKREDAWVLRFSLKTGEQDPVALEDVYSHLALIEGLRDDFKIETDKKELLGESRLRFVSYNYNSRQRDEAGKAVRGYGIIATFAATSGDLPVVYAMKIEAVGRKGSYTRADLAPFLQPMMAR